MNNEMLWYLVNTLESISVVATEDNLSKLLACIQVLKKAAKKADAETEKKGGTSDG